MLFRFKTEVSDHCARACGDSDGSIDDACQWLNCFVFCINFQLYSTLLRFFFRGSWLLLNWLLLLLRLVIIVGLRCLLSRHVDLYYCRLSLGIGYISSIRIITFVSSIIFPVLRVVRRLLFKDTERKQVEDVPKESSYELLIGCTSTGHDSFKLLLMFLIDLHGLHFRQGHWTQKSYGDQ